MIRILRTNCDFEREPLISPFGFKGGYLTELWQTAALIQSFSGKRGLGLGTQSVLWSDAGVFAENSESAGNALMFAMTSFALKQAGRCCMADPLYLLDELLKPTLDHGRAITSRPDLRLTFALNSLVAVDNAGWQLYCAEKGIASFDEMVPEAFRPALSHRHRELGVIPLMTYGVPLDEIVQAARDGFFLLKIKIGSDPDKDGDPEKMLAWDIDRLASIHSAVKSFETPHTDSGRVLYYLDANGRYDSKERLVRFIDAAEKMGALDRIVLLEEPFPEEAEIDVHDVPVRLAADESAHSDADAAKRIDLGYGAIALKPIAKTMSMSLRIAKLAHERGVPCFCADLTVNPILVDWNKNVAARLAPLPGVKIGVVETNGHQNYRNWERMKSYHPRAGAPWTEITHGVFRLDDDFYAASGGILEQSEHYLALVS
jgi:hypothetical protein